MRWAFTVLFTLLGTCAFGFDLRFEQPLYNVVTGETYEVRVVMDPVPTNGLFSVGVRMNYDSNFVRVVSTNDIILPAALGSNGLGDPAFKTLEPGMAGGAGALDLDAANAYDQAVVMSFQLQNLAASGTVYQLELELFFDSRANFVAFDNGEVLDGQITNFIASTINVVEGSLDPVPAEIVAFDPPDLGPGLLTFTNITTALFDYVLESTPDLVDTQSWQVVSGGVLSTNAPGQFSFSLPVGADEVEHYRVQTVVRP